MISLPVFGLSRLRIGVDGAGVTTLVGCLGCPLKCRFCINPHARDASVPAKMYTPEQLVSALRVDHLYFAATNGGATFGGGESLLHAPFIAEFAKVKPKEWKLNIETSLNAPEDAVRMLLPHVDEWIVDVKDMNPEIYRAYTGKDNARVLRNLALLNPDRTHIRVPLIPGFNTAEDADRSESILREMGFHRIERFEYLMR